MALKLASDRFGFKTPTGAEVDALVQAGAGASSTLTPTELVPIEGYGASEVRFGWAISAAAIAGAGLLGWYLFGAAKKKKRKGRRRRWS